MPETTMDEVTIDLITNEVFNLYTKYGNNEYIGEPVSQLEHMSQSAQLALSERCDDEIILAAFFHDIGHLCVAKNDVNNMGGFGIKSHEKIGADFLRAKGFPERVAKLVENHVQAKRYLAFKHPVYYNGLSEASKTTLTFQGGMMTTEESNVFEKDPLFKTSILLRKWDELAKETGIPITNLDDLKAIARRVLGENVNR